MNGKWRIQLFNISKEDCSDGGKYFDRVIKLNDNDNDLYIVKLLILLD